MERKRAVAEGGIVVPLRQFDPREDKLKELVLYISQKCAYHRGFGSVKLNKILYFSDFLHYQKTGTPITGMEYQSLQFGPAPRRMKPSLDHLQESSQIVMQITSTAGRVRKKPVNLVEADLSLFTAAEIASVDNVIECFEELTADRVSEFSHDWGGWKYTGQGATIPYESVFVSDRPITLSDRESGMKVAEKHGLVDG